MAYIDRTQSIAVNGERYDVVSTHNHFIPYRLVKGTSHNQVYRHRTKENILYGYLEGKPVFFTISGHNVLKVMPL